MNLNSKKFRYALAGLSFLLLAGLSVFIFFPRSSGAQSILPCVSVGPVQTLPKQTGLRVQLDYSTVKDRQIINQTGKVLFNFVSIAKLNEDRFVIPAYSTLYLFHRKTGEVSVLSPDFTHAPSWGGNKTYVPTGVAIDSEGDLFLANYEGNNILRGTIDASSGTVVFTHSYASAQSGGPENVAVDRKRDVLFSANYDAGTVTAFQISTGKQLWSASVGQAHGVAFHGDVVYATSLLSRQIVKLDFQTGKCLDQRGKIGWDPAKDEYLWPTSIQVLSNGELIVADAQTGYISILDEKSLAVKRYFGGNGPGTKLFNYPYAAIPFDGEIAVLSAKRMQMLFLNHDLKVKEAFYLEQEHWPKNNDQPFGKDWDQYIDKSGKNDIKFGKHVLRPGFNHFYSSSGTPIFQITDMGQLYNADLYLNLMQSRQINERTSCFFSPSARILYTIQQNENGVPPFLLMWPIPNDAWLTDDSIIYHGGTFFSLKDLAAQSEKKGQLLLELFQKQHRFTLADICEHIYWSGLRTKPNQVKQSDGGMKDRESTKTMLPPDFEKQINQTFTSAAGRIFLLQYDKAGDDLEKIRAAGIQYFRSVQSLGEINFSEYILIGMLSGISGEQIAEVDHGNFKTDDTKLLAKTLPALSTPELNDYAAADDFKSSIFFYPPDPNAVLKQIDLLWYSQAESGTGVRVWGCMEGASPELLYSSDALSSRLSCGYAHSTILLPKNEKSFSHYQFQVVAGKGQKRLLLRELLPVWKSAAGDNAKLDPLMQEMISVSSLKTYGNGGARPNFTTKELLALPTWHCGNFARYFALTQSIVDVEWLRITGLKSPNGARHTVVEVKQNGKLKVVDPTLAIVYDASLEELISGTADYDQITHFGKPVSGIFYKYWGPQFFFRAEIIQEYPMNIVKMEKK